jgi:hypothetical protein
MSRAAILLSQIKTKGLVIVEMDAIEAVIDLVKERDELMDIVETYENELESLVGKTVLLTVGRKNHKRFIECEVTDFSGIDGWELTSSDNEVHTVTFSDFVSGKVQLT